MRIGIISDTHFGDRTSILVPLENGTPVLGERYNLFRNAIGDRPLDYLVLLGDIIDQSVVSYETGYAAAKVFLSQCQRDNIAERYLYVPGNHDFDVWTSVEYEVNIVRQIGSGNPGRPFRWAVPAVLDNRDGEHDPRTVLPTVSLGENPDQEKPYGGLFLDRLAGGESGQPQHFLFAYPNAYLITDEGECVLLTHGHYFEQFWSILGDWAPHVFGDDLVDNDEIITAENKTVAQFVAMNFPQCQLSCSGVGQAGPLSILTRDIQLQVKNHQLDNVDRYLKALEREIDALTEDPGWNPARLKDKLQEIAYDLVASEGRKRLLKALKKRKPARGNADYLTDPATRERFYQFFRATLREIDRLKAEGLADIPYPTTMIFGHTHRPVAWGSDVEEIHNPEFTDGVSIRAYNTGGWLSPPTDSSGERGALVFIYETGHGFEQSVSVPVD